MRIKNIEGLCAKKTEDVVRIMTNIHKNDEQIDQEKERLWGVYLDEAGKIKRVDLISMGSVRQTAYHPREILRPAIECSASYLIMVHNHCKDNLEPTKKDLVNTKNLMSVCKKIGIPMIDSLIIDGYGKYRSVKKDLEKERS